MNLQHEKLSVDEGPPWSSVDLPHHRVVFPYGLPVCVRSNDLGVIRTAEHSWGACCPRYREKPIELSVFVSGASSRPKPPRPVFSIESNLMTIVADTGNYAYCDLANGLGFACLEKNAVLDEKYLRYYFLEAMAYTLLDTLHLVIFHAACASYQGSGFLFVGESGAGKSSLAYACARRDWTYVSDDATAVLRRRRTCTVLGNARTIRFRPAARELFPEISGPVELRDGKPTIEISIDSLPEILTADACSLDFVLLLYRSHNLQQPPTLVPIAQKKALQSLFHQKFPEQLGIGEERLRTLQGLVDGTQVCEFTYADLNSAVSYLEEWGSTR